MNKFHIKSIRNQAKPKEKSLINDQSQKKPKKHKRPDRVLIQIISSAYLILEILRWVLVLKGATFRAFYVLNFQVGTNLMHKSNGLAFLFPMGIAFKYSKLYLQPKVEYDYVDWSWDRWGRN